ncbi:MAG: branched-chain amino acid transport system ATP-binding protein livM [Actinomycetota bacterium]|nr:branched-chain amino acid transport system ATP-binding protein livM [Actinomycetota bacterium]MDQ1499381.1 branched-chain amino acid transport system ATP-binding protein livM [Actinomycetota bacterium]
MTAPLESPPLATPAATDRPQTVERPPAARPAAGTPLALRLTAVAITAVVVIALPQVMSNYWIFIGTAVAIVSLALMSLVLLTGMVGQISLCQGTFMGVGAFSMAYLQHHADMPFLPAWIIGAGAAALVGVLVGLPALRVGGLHLALVTLAFGYMFDNTVFNWNSFSGGASYGIDFGRPAGFQSATAYFYFCAAVLALAVFLFARFRSSKSGQLMSAVGEAPKAVAATGWSVMMVQLRGFALSAFIAGLAGGLFGPLYGNAGKYAFDVNHSLVLMAMAAIGGVGFVLGAVIGGVMNVALPEVVRNLNLTADWGVLIPSVAVVVVMVTNPRGIAHWVTRLGQRLLHLGGGKKTIDLTAGKVPR